MENPLIITVTQGSYINKHPIYLPSEKPVQNPHDLKVKFYLRSIRQYPRNDTQIYVNNKYFFVINSPLREETKENISNIIKYCYMYGLSIEQIKTEFKKAYGRI